MIYLKNYRLFFLTSILQFPTLLTSCNNDDGNQNQEEFPREVEFEKIVNYRISPNFNNENLENQKIIINSQSDWDSFFSEYPFPISLFNNVNINWDEETIIAIFSNIVGDTRFSIKTISILEYRNNLDLTFSKLEHNDAFFPVINIPFSFIKIPKTTQPIEFIEE